MSESEAPEPSAIGFDLAGWSPIEPPIAGVWQGESGAVLSLRRLTAPLDLAPDASEDEVRLLFEAHQGRGDRFLEVRSTSIEAIRCWRITLEEPLDPHRPFGKSFLIWLLIPVTTGGWTISIAASEQGTTGLRETLLMDRFLHEVIGEEGLDATQAALARVRSEAMDERWDADFPDHPLTIAREAMSRIERSLTFQPVTPVESRNEAT